MRFIAISLLFLIATSVGAETYGQAEILKLRNDKEVLISSFNEKERQKALQAYSDSSTRNKITQTFYASMKSFLNGKTAKCELHLSQLLVDRFGDAGLKNDQKHLELQLKLLRSTNAVDDILYEILSSNNRILFEIKNLNTKKRPKVQILKHKDLIENNDVQELYSNFDEFPDEDSLCAFQEFIYLQNNIRGKDGRKSTRPLTHMKVLTRYAYEEKLIPLESYHKLEYLRTKSGISKRMIWLNDYLKIVFQAKNQMVPNRKTYTPIKLEDEDIYSSVRLKRFSSLTRRKLLYKKYDETQIILLAQLLKKASKRMGTDADTVSGIPYILQEFTTTGTNGKRETYVERINLDPQSQFNLARRLLRKDMTELQMMDLFNGLTITHQDIVLAAFETGYITIEDIAYVVRYDDLWNPEITKYERVRGLVFRVAGYSTFFLPTPWNVVGTIALGVVEGVLENNNRNGANNDNPATFIE